jgi:hypothetical protein
MAQLMNRKSGLNQVKELSFLIRLKFYFFLDSLAMDRLRKAILGKDGKNLDDVEFMSGKNAS